MTNYEIVHVDWDKVLTEHQQRLEKEKLLRKQKSKHESWALYRECTTYLQENERNWQLRKQEMKKQERLLIAKNIQEEIRENERKKYRQRY